MGKALGDLGRRAGDLLGSDGAAAAKLLSFSGPGSLSVLANVVLHAEVQVDWAVELMLAAKRRGITEVEPRIDAARAWTDHVAQAAERILFPKARSSWDLGANIDGKKRVFMPYAGGFGNYRRHLDDIARQVTRAWS
jgi:hypothetical protein